MIRAPTPRLTFEQFVTGTSNRFSHAAALAVAETPAGAYNPLFIHGDSGLGKTHLLRAICHYVNHHYPSYKVRYVTSETFLNEFVQAIRNSTQPEFKQIYRSNDLLLVDDIQFMEGKDGLQEEFFHTFNDLLQNGAQIVLSSDRGPRCHAHAGRPAPESLQVRPHHRHPAARPCDSSRHSGKES